MSRAANIFLHALPSDKFIEVHVFFLLICQCSSFSKTQLGFKLQSALDFERALFFFKDRNFDKILLTKCRQGLDKKELIISRTLNLYPSLKNAALHSCLQEGLHPPFLLLMVLAYLRSRAEGGISYGRGGDARQKII